MNDTDDEKMARYQAGRQCPRCGHGYYQHGSSKGCTYIVKVNGDPLCHCSEPRQTWDQETGRWTAQTV